MQTKSFTAIAVLVLTLTTSAAKAHAEDVANTPSVVTLFGSLGIDGNIQAENSEDDLGSAFGLGLLYAKSLHEHFFLGAGLSLISWLGDGNGNNEPDRNLLINLGLRPEAVFPASSKIELLAAGIIGLSFSQIGESDLGLGEIQPALGFHLGVALGARFALKEGHGLQLELVLQRHQAEHEVDTVIGDFKVDSELALAMLNLGYFFE